MANNIFGENAVDYMKLIEQTYLYDGKNRIGYRVGAAVLSAIGITNNLENRIVIVTNNFNIKPMSELVQLKKPVITVTNDNYQYLQLLDTLKDIDKYHLTNDNISEKIVEYMNKNEMEVDKLFEIAKVVDTRCQIR